LALAKPSPGVSEKDVRKYATHGKRLRDSTQLALVLARFAPFLRLPVIDVAPRQHTKEDATIVEEAEVCRTRTFSNALR